MIYITHIRLSSEGTDHEHITNVKWHDSVRDERKHCTTEVMVDYIKKDNAVYVTDGDNTVRVGVYKDKYLRTHADGKWTNNLLSLPRF